MLVLVRGDRPRQRDQARQRARRARRGRPPRAGRGARSDRPASSAPSAPPGDVEILLDAAAVAAASDGGGYVTGANRADDAPARRRARAATSAFARSTCARVAAGRHGRRRADHDRAGDRGRQHLQARHALLGAAGRQLPRRERRRAAVWMGSYGIGPARIVAAAVEQFADEHGISWPRALAPFAVHLVALGKPGTPEREAAERVYETLREGGVEVLYDDRDLGPGREVRRRRAARLPAAADRRAPLAGVGRDRGAGPPRPRAGARLPLDAEPQELVRAVESCGRASPRAAPAGERAAPARRERRAGAARRLAPPAARARPLRAAAAADARRASRCARGRSPTRSASCASR